MGKKMIYALCSAHGLLGAGLNKERLQTFDFATLHSNVKSDHMAFGDLESADVRSADYALGTRHERACRTA